MARFRLNDIHRLVEYFDSNALHALFGIGIVNRHREIWNGEARTNDNAATLFDATTNGLEFFQRQFVLVRHDVFIV